MQTINVTVTYALPDQQPVFSVSLKSTAVVLDALLASGILKQFPEIDLKTQRVGIFSECVMLSEKLKDGDRVEIYRPLTIDPKDARRLRAQKRA
ncbi:MAG: RnfH family protein [Gammaproteobacteria bacterium CG11_big_fil_rev_8_21_14_0_20_46_22]|nr:MAG: RnfH family protein [Gammaproteobacteria bacterium CG12_big_fil_rev_8_21_14_0_65_46_12]PIR11067.1 MAG: RnfH family protein [Gammaproteobacteria bacterium CG11_big_fil_rev_8_21_14_0_20_46_22]